MIVAIDGPAGSGKSTTARRVADRLGWLYLDTGAMYRAVGLAFRDQELPFTEEAAAALMPGLTVRLDPVSDGVLVSVNGADVTERIRSSEASDGASRVSALAPVRVAMVDAQRAVAGDQAGSGRGVVVEGRDIGTVVFPDAAVKFFLIADLEARAARRSADSGADGVREEEVARVRAELAERDRRDESREIAPLRAADDAVTLDTTHLTIEEQVDIVIAAVRRAQGDRL